MRNRSNNLEGTNQMLVDVHDSAGIVELTTVIGGTKQSD